MNFEEEYKDRDDVFKYERCNFPTLYFVPNNQGLYVFCTENRTDDEKKVQRWMNCVKNTAVPLEHIPYVIWDAEMKALGRGVICDYDIMEWEIAKFAKTNGIKLQKNMLPSKQPKKRGSIQVIGLAVEKYVERCIDPDDKRKKKVSERYHLLVRDIKNKRKYEITIQTRTWDSGCGYGLNTRGKIDIEKLDKNKPFSHTPIETMFIEGFSIDPSTLGWKQEHYTKRYEGDDDIYIENNVFSFSEFGGDMCYPRGSARINMQRFAVLPRAMEKRPVWIIKGPSGTGKSTLAGHIEGLDVFETDSVDKLPKEIDADVIVLGNRSKFTVDDIKSHLFGEVNVIQVSFEQSTGQRINILGKRPTKEKE